MSWDDPRERKTYGLVKCQTCGAELIRTSVRYLCCIKGHGKLIQDMSHQNIGEADREEAAFLARAVRRIKESRATELAARQPAGFFRLTKSAGKVMPSPIEGGVFCLVEFYRPELKQFGLCRQVYDRQKLHLPAEQAEQGKRFVSVWSDHLDPIAMEKMRVIEAPTGAGAICAKIKPKPKAKINKLKPSGFLEQCNAKR